MPAPLAVDREQVRMLVLAVGVSEAARQTGIDLSTVKQWSARGEWLKHLREPAQVQMPTSMQPVAVTGVTKPADALANTLKERKGQMQLAQSKYLVRASEALADAPEDLLLEHAQTGKALADMASKVYPETDSNSHLSLNFFSLSSPEPEKPPEGRVIDQE